MGAGCYYTHNFKPNGESKLAYWINTPEEYAGDYQSFVSQLRSKLIKLGYSIESNRGEFWAENGLYRVKFVPKYYGDGYIIDISPSFSQFCPYSGDFNPKWNLAVANFDRAERKIAKYLNKFYKLYYATSGYTANTI